MRKFLCYDTNDAASGKIGVNNNGVLSPNATVPSTNGSAYQQLVTDGEGNTKQENRLCYTGVGLQEIGNDTVKDDSNTVLETGYYFQNSNLNISLLGNAGAKYVIEFNGEKYDCICRQTYDDFVFAIGNSAIVDASKEDTGEPFFIYESMEGHNVVYWKEISGNPVKVISYVEKEVVKQIPEMFIPVMSSVTLKSSTSGSSKKFKITVDDSGVITATEV